jgi:hypothetical protein
VSHLIDRRRGARTHARPVSTGRPRSSPRGPSASPRTRGDHERDSQPEPRPQRDRGLGLLAVFTCAMLLIVGLATLAAAIDRMWILAPVMAIDLAVTTLVIATIARLLNDADDR